MNRTRSVLTIFLASPSDVTRERQLAEEVVASVTKLIGHKLGWHIDLSKWEDSVPGFGRPQAQINPLVDECDIFLGLLWERWGQPSGTHSSGFEEEYQRAKDRRRVSGAPEIWLVFKEVGRERLTDPGDQLKKVLEFRKTEEALQEVLFKAVRDEEDWKNKLQNWLVTYILSLPSQTQLQPTSSVPRFNSQIPASASLPDEDDTEDTSTLQLTTALDHFKSALAEGPFEFTSRAEHTPDEFDVVRLYLFVASLSSHRFTRQLLATHETNLLYKHRAKLETTGGEQHQLFRTMIGDHSDVIPGWFWQRDADLQKVETILFSLIFDGSEDVSYGSLNLMTKACIPVPRELWQSLPFNDASLRVQEAAFSILCNFANAETLAFLEDLPEEDRSFSFARERAIFEVLLALHPERAFAKAREGQSYLSDAELRLLLKALSRIESKTLVAASENPREQIRKISVEELLRRGGLSVELAEKLTKDESIAVRSMCYCSLARNGILPRFSELRKSLKSEKESSGLMPEFLLSDRELDRYPGVDDVIAAYFRSKTTEELQGLVDWFTVEGRIAYGVLAVDRFESMAGQLRYDLKDGFQRLKSASYSREGAKWGRASAKISAEWSELDWFIATQFTEAALRGLAGHPEPDDAELARLHLSETFSSTIEPAVAIIGLKGGPEDVPALIKIAEEGNGAVESKAAEAALNLSLDPLKTALAFMASGYTKRGDTAYQWLVAKNLQGTDQLFRAMILAKDEKNRTRSIHYLSQHLKTGELEVLMNEHMERDAYYYNVIAWVDRLLFAPAQLRAAYAKDLQDQAFGEKDGGEEPKISC